VLTRVCWYRPWRGVTSPQEVVDEPHALWPVRLMVYRDRAHRPTGEQLYQDYVVDALPVSVICQRYQLRNYQSLYPWLREYGIEKRGWTESPENKQPVLDVRTPLQGKCKKGHPYSEYGAYFLNTQGKVKRQCLECKRLRYHATGSVLHPYGGEFCHRGHRYDGVREKDQARICSTCTRITYLKNEYGVSLEWYEETLEQQGGGCATCGGPPGGSRVFFCVDHNHKTGRVRGLLCKDCNLALGIVEEDPIVLELLAQYIRDHETKETSCHE
jgi:hypothetical protein